MSIINDENNKLMTRGNTDKSSFDEKQKLADKLMDLDSLKRLGINFGEIISLCSNVSNSKLEDINVSSFEETRENDSYEYALSNLRFDEKLKLFINVELSDMSDETKNFWKEAIDTSVSDNIDELLESPITYSESHNEYIGSAKSKVNKKIR